MKSHFFFPVLLLAVVLGSFAMAGEPVAATKPVPRLQVRGIAEQLIVDGKPFLVLGGELQNSSSSSLDYMQPIWPKLAAMHLNTVLAPVSWELIEPAEGKFDFTLVDGLITGARQHRLHLVFLWFGSWKNTYSSYVPEWVKRDVTRFPRVQGRDGRNTERLSPFSLNGQAADARAFAALMRHVREVDGEAHTVIMVQVENEVGVIPESRDYSGAADSAYAAAVPKELTDYLRRNAYSLAPELQQAKKATGKTSGSWEEMFGKSSLTDDFFMAWHFAKYIDAVTAAGKAEYPLLMYTNAALIRPNYEPGQYNSGGPLPHSIDIWRAAAPHLDFLSPDIYFDNFAEWASQYDRAGNPLFVPEAFGGEAGAANAFYAIGHHNAIGFSPYGIDEPVGSPQSSDAKVPDKAIADSYAALSYLAPLILERQGTDRIAAAVLEGESQRAARVSIGGYTMNITRANRCDPPKPCRTAALFLQTGPDEYVVAGFGESLVAFTPASPGLPTAGIASIDEEVLHEGQVRRERRLNGDENAQGQLLKIIPRESGHPVIYRVRLYRY